MNCFLFWVGVKCPRLSITSLIIADRHWILQVELMDLGLVLISMQHGHMNNDGG